MVIKVKVSLVNTRWIHLEDSLPPVNIYCWPLQETVKHSGGPHSNYTRSDQHSLRGHGGGGAYANDAGTRTVRERSSRTGSGCAARSTRDFK